MEVADGQEIPAKPIGEGVARPRPEDRRHDDDRQPPAGVATDEHVQRRVEDADEDREDERGIEAHAPPPCDADPAPTGARSTNEREADAADVTGATAGRAIRPPPSTTSPSYRTAA